MLMNLHKKLWTRGLAVPLPTATPTAASASAASVAGAAAAASANEELLGSVAAMSEAYAKRVAEEEGASKAQLAVMGVGKVDPKKRLEADVGALLAANVVGTVGALTSADVF